MTPKQTSASKCIDTTDSNTRKTEQRKIYATRGTFTQFIMNQRCLHQRNMSFVISSQSILVIQLCQIDIVIVRRSSRNRYSIFLFCFHLDPTSLKKV